MKKILPAILLIALFSSFYSAETLKGKWNYAGGIENGAYEGPPTDYILQRKYDTAHFTAIVIEKGVKPEKYETGNYSLAGDTCRETQTWCGQDSKLIGVTINYNYVLRNDSLILTGTLPNGTAVTEYWKRAK